jgi:hypothetical protein
MFCFFIVFLLGDNYGRVVPHGPSIWVIKLTFKESTLSFVDYLVFVVAEEQTQGLASARQMLYH